MRICNPLGDSTNPIPIKLCDDAASDYSTGRSTRNALNADLLRVVGAWPTLPAVIKPGILA
jgi:hypothetical protein